MSAPVAETPVATAPLRPLTSTERAQTEYVVVDVVGEVRHPGVVRLPRGSRVVDAVAAAGGLRRGEAPIINMARVLVDGEQLAIGASDTNRSTAVSAQSSGKVDVNQATAGELDALPGIGPVLAQRIVEYRAKHGSFAHTRDLLDVPGIGDSKFGQLSDAVSVG